MSGSPPFRLCLIEGRWNPEQRSMPLYCDEIARLLGETPGTEVLRIRPRKTGVRFTALARRQAQWVDLPRQLAGIHADVFHCVEPGDVWAARRLDPRRVVATCHDLIPWRLRHMLRAGWRARLGVSDFTYRKMWDGLRRIAWIITDSECSRRDILEYSGISPDRVSVVSNWLNPVFQPLPPGERAPARQRLSASYRIPEGFWFLHVGSTSFYKNIEAILTALAELRRVSPRLEPYFLRVGTPLSPAQKALSERLGIRDRVVELGELSLEEMVKAYGCCDAFVFPSWYEGFGRPALEAMACGLPVIAGNAGSLPEVVEDAAALVDPANAGSLAAAMRRMMEDPPFRKQLAEAGARRVYRHRMIDVASGFLRVYRQVLERADR